MTDWPFDQAPNVAAITSSHILEKNLPILQVTHYDDDHSWGFQSGFPVTMDEGKVIAMQEALKIDPTLSEISDLEPGWSAERDHVGGEWTRAKDEWSDEE